MWLAVEQHQMADAFKMKLYLRLFFALLVCLGVGVIHGQTYPDGSRDVLLTATIRLENNGDQDISGYVFRLTVPVDIPHQQQVLGITSTYTGDVQFLNHPNQVDRYANAVFDMRRASVAEHEVYFKIRLTPFNYRRDRGNESTLGNANFLRATTYVESGAPEITSVAQQIFSAHGNAEQRLIAAFNYPQQILDYRNISNKGALFAIRYGYGDCTEYASLFAAISRAMGYPARLSSEFNFDSELVTSQPNHHAAEVFLDGRWIPVDPNLATDVSSGYGFGQAAAHKVVLKRDGSWVWAASATGMSSSYSNAYIRESVEWSIR